MRISDWSSDVCSSDLCGLDFHYDHSPRDVQAEVFAAQIALAREHDLALVIHTREAWPETFDILAAEGVPERTVFHCFTGGRSEEHTSELQSLMRISYAVFCLKKKTNTRRHVRKTTYHKHTHKNISH